MKSQSPTIDVARNDTRIVIPTEQVILAISHANEMFKKFAKVNDNLDLFAILGMRNLSAFVGEVYVASLAQVTTSLLMKNPHQDGYPDLLLMDSLGQEVLSTISDLHDKAPFSPFAAGGIEVKATCGAVPTPAQCKKRGFSKPEIGDSRLGKITGYDWKAHHRETNNLIGILWDFVNRVPEIVALFYSSELTTEDWGKIVKPKDNGGRTTSVSIMTRTGVKKMAEGCLYCKDEPILIDFINRYNEINLAALM